MIVKCQKIISPATHEDLGEASPWLVKGKEYVVYALHYDEKFGIDIFIQTEHYDEPHFIPIVGFEIISQKIPSTWITLEKRTNSGKKIIKMLPKLWSYPSFFEDLTEELPEAVELFTQEGTKIYNEEYGEPSE
jgi:hypothetical protein